MKERSHLCRSVVPAIIVLCFCLNAFSQTSVFTYQGRLTDGGVAANGTYQMQFSLYDAVSGGTQIGSTITNNSVMVSNGIFTVHLDFSPATPFSTGADRWLELAVKRPSEPAFTPLVPRQPLTSSPYSVRTLSAGASDSLSSICVGCVDDTHVSDAITVGVAGSVSDSALSPNVAHLNVSETITANWNNSANPWTDAEVSNILTISNGSVVEDAALSIQVAHLNSPETITANWSNTLNPWADNEVANNLTIDGGSVDDTLIGSITPSAGTFTTLTATTASANIINASTQYNLQGNRILTAQLMQRSLFAGIGAGTNNTGNDNSFFGRNAGFTNISGSSNSFFGHNAGVSSTGSNNSIFGSDAGDGSLTGNDNSFFGKDAGGLNSSGTGNSFFGAGAGIGTGTGGNNTFIGFGAGNNNTTGGNNTAIGAGTDVGSGLNFATAVGAGAFVTTSNTIALGRLVDTVTILGRLKLNTLGSAGSVTLCRNVDSEIATCSSSLRYKTNVAPFTAGLSLVERLRPITFDWRSGGTHDLGFGAEDVAAIDPLFVTYNQKGEVEGVKYDRLSVVFVNAIQQQQQQIEAQQKQIDELKQIVCALKPKVAACRENIR